VWRVTVGSGYSGPVVAGDRLILFHRIENQEIVACLDAATGKEKWKFAYPTDYRDDFGFDDGPRSTPLIHGKNVYTLGAEGRLHCLELETGNKVWARALNTEYEVPKGYFGVGTSPLIEGDLLLLNVGGSSAGIVALNKDTGKEVWKATDHEASYASPVAGTFHGSRVAAFFTREGIVLLDPQSGKIRYSKHFRAPIRASVNAASPLVVDDLIFYSACYGTGALLLRVGKDTVEEVWKGEDIMTNHYATCAAYQGHLYGFDGRQEEGARLRCVELKTGKVCWTRDRMGCGSLIVADGQLIILNERGELVLAEATAEAYQEKARATVLEDKCRSCIALANGRLYGRDGKKLVCWNLKK
jgi:outer membrane protein assembly factor BamB